MTICTDNPDNIDNILLRLSTAVEISNNPVDSPPMILKYLDKSNL
jgi:hypothetical protein